MGLPGKKRKPVKGAAKGSNPHTASRGKLLSAAWEVAAYYRAHRAYGSESRAAKALARRCPGFTARQYQNAFAKAVSMYDAAVTLCERDADLLASQTDEAANRYPDLRDQAKELRQLCPGFRRSTYWWAMLWVFSWYHLR